ncbi:MAG: hypothetical protein IJ068_06720 [Bacilli bacterium]|nr:hypothetical protein [Bacilli bacterium]
MNKVFRFVYGLGCFIIAQALFLGVIDTSNIKSFLIIILNAIAFIMLVMKEQ